MSPNIILPSVTFISSRFIGFIQFQSVSLDIEDKENWHGKPIPKDKLDDVLKDLQSQIQVPNKTLSPKPPNNDAAPADLSTIVMPSVPSYKKGDKVQLYHKSSPTNVIYFISLTCLFCTRWQQGEHMAMHWPNWVRQAREWSPSMETPRTPPSLSSLRRSFLTVTSSVSLLNRTW